MENGHCPVICKLASLWIASKDDAGTSKWIEANTRKCPKCHNSIEKAGGCKYVSSALTLSSIQVDPSQPHALSSLQVPILLDVYEEVGCPWI